MTAEELFRAEGGLPCVTVTRFRDGKIHVTFKEDVIVFGSLFYEGINLCGSVRDVPEPSSLQPPLPRIFMELPGSLGSCLSQTLPLTSTPGSGRCRTAVPALPPPAVPSSPTLFCGPTRSAGSVDESSDAAVQTIYDRHPFLHPGRSSPGTVNGGKPLR